MIQYKQEALKQAISSILIMLEKKLKNVNIEEFLKYILF